jgi:hypothetical protein
MNPDDRLLATLQENERINRRRASTRAVKVVLALCAFAVFLGIKGRASYFGVTIAEYLTGQIPP